MAGDAVVEGASAAALVRLVARLVAVVVAVVDTSSESSEVAGAVGALVEVLVVEVLVVGVAAGVAEEVVMGVEVLSDEVEAGQSALGELLVMPSPPLFTNLQPSYSYWCRV